MAGNDHLSLQLEQFGWSLHFRSNIYFSLNQNDKGDPSIQLSLPMIKRKKQSSRLC